MIFWIDTKAEWLRVNESLVRMFISGAGYTDVEKIVTTLLQPDCYQLTATAFYKDSDAPGNTDLYYCMIRRNHERREWEYKSEKNTWMLDKPADF